MYVRDLHKKEPCIVQWTGEEIGVLGECEN